LVVRDSSGRNFVTARELESAVPKPADILSSASQNSDTAQFVSVALFSGVGLLISLIIVILRIHGVF